MEKSIEDIEWELKKRSSRASLSKPVHTRIELEYFNAQQESVNDLRYAENAAYDDVRRAEFETKNLLNL